MRKAGQCRKSTSTVEITYRKFTVEDCKGISGFKASAPLARLLVFVHFCPPSLLSSKRSNRAPWYFTQKRGASRGIYAFLKGNKRSKQAHRGKGVPLNWADWSTPLPKQQQVLCKRINPLYSGSARIGLLLWLLFVCVLGIREDAGGGGGAGGGRGFNKKVIEPRF